MQGFQHQKSIYELAKDRKYYGLLMEQGTGKTRLAIRLAEQHFREGRITAVLVITTKGLVRNWSDVELPKHAECEYWAYVWPNKFQNIPKSVLQYWMVNIDALITDKWVARFREFQKLHPNFMCILDESTVIKTPSAKRTKRAWSVGNLAQCRLIMTGVPAPNSPMDLYAQCKFLSPNALGFKDFTQFRYRYAELVLKKFGNGRTFLEIDGYKNLPELKQKLSGFTSIIKKEDCLDLPPTRQRIVPVPLTKEQRKAYDELRKEMITYVQGEVVEVTNVVSFINKGLQICSGQIKMPDGRYLGLPTNRLDVLEELVEECQGQSIVWTAFVNNAVTIGKRFGRNALLLPSGLTLDQRQDLLDRFRSGEGKILVANPASAGHGLTLVNCSNAIHYSRLFNYEHRAQADARIHRIGQTKPCLYTDLLDPSTLEKKVVNILTKKQEMSNYIMDRKFLTDMIEEQ